MKYNKKSYKSKSKKKITYKRKNRAVTKFKSTLSLGKGFPRKMIVTHKYVELFSMSAFGANIATQQFVCNGMFDPNYSGLGHQPMYFDQMTALYNHYTVIGAKIKVTPVNVSDVGSVDPFWFALAQNDDGTIGYNSLATLSERSDGQCRLMSTASSDRNPTLINKWSAKKSFGGSILGNDQLQGTSGANPIEITNWVIALQAADGVGTVNIRMLVEIEYIAVWDELKEVDGS